MGPKSAGRVVLLSIRPEFAGAIFAGDKTVEFRRKPLAPDVETALVYATKPVGGVLGWFTIARLINSTPKAIWRRFGGRGAIGRHAYFNYFEGAQRAFAIEVDEVFNLDRSLSLGEVSPNLRAPQSFQYLDAADVARALHQANFTSEARHQHRAQPAL